MDVKGKLPMNGSTLPHVTKGTVAVLQTYQTVNRHTPPSDRAIDHNPYIRNKLNLMIDNIELSLNKINDTFVQYVTTCGVIGDHDWSQYLQPLGHLGVDPYSVDLRPVVTILLDCACNHCKKTCTQLLDDIRSHIEETHHSLITSTTPSKESDIRRLITASLNTFTNYIKHKHQPVTATPTMEEAEEMSNKTSTQSNCSVSSDAVMAQLNYSNITEVSSPSTNTGASYHDNRRKRNNRKSKKDRSKHTHDAQRCVRPDCFSCAKENVVNLTGKPLTRQQTTLLSRGLSFIPRTPESDARELMTDLGTFIRNTKIKCGKLLVQSQREQSRKSKHISGTPSLIPSYEGDSHWRKQTDWPSNRLLSSQMENNFHAMRQELAILTESEFGNSEKQTFNLTRKEHRALERFARTSSLVFKKGDKTTCIVVKNRKDYVREGMVHLSDTKTYMRLDRDYTPDVVQYIKYTLQQYSRGGLLSGHMVRQCMPRSECRTALLYFLTKTHKSPMTLRPIVSQVGSATVNMATFLDQYLQPMVRELPAYLKDSTQFIREVTALPIGPEDILVTVDVKSLYTCIPTQEGLDACYRAWLKSETKNPQQPPAETLRHMLEMVLKLNVLEFDRKHYLQIFGTSMGAALAPSYANIFMGNLEEKMLNTAKIKPKYYKRFIDDIFFIVDCDEIQLTEFITHMNSQNPSIQFTHECSKVEITFLDVTVYRDRNKLQVKTFIKPTNKQLYINNKSYHPPGATKGVALGEAIRYLRTNSDRRQFYKMMFLHKRNLLRRGYPRSLINQTMKKVKFSMRNELMMPKSEQIKTYEYKKNGSGPVFVTRYCHRARKVFRIVEKYWCRLRSDHAGINRYITNRPTLAYRSNQNLARKLVRAKLKRHNRRHHKRSNDSTTTTDIAGATSNINSSHSSCNSNCSNIQGNMDIASLAGIKYNVDIGLKVCTKRCKDRSCPLYGKLRCTNQARSNISKRAYITRGAADCNTKSVVYLIQCKKCGRQYVGQTGKSLKERLYKHLQKIKYNKEANTLHEHFNRGTCKGVHNMIVQILQVVDCTNLSNEQIETELKTIELLWIDRLMSEYPQGLNYARQDQIKRHMYYK